MQRKFSSQRGVGLGYLLFMVAIAALVGNYMLNNSTSMSGIAIDSQSMAAANDLDRSANELSVRMAQLRMTYGGNVAVRITNGQLVSPTSAFPAMTIPPLPSSAAITGWAMSENNRLQVPVTGDLLLIATANVSSAICKKFNATHIRPDDPTITTAGNAYGGQTYTVSNTPAFNNGQPSTLFCAPGAGAGGAGLMVLGFLTT